MDAIRVGRGGSCGANSGLVSVGSRVFHKDKCHLWAGEKNTPGERGPPGRCLGTRTDRKMLKGGQLGGEARQRSCMNAEVGLVSGS